MLVISFAMMNKASRAYLEVFHSLLLFEHPRPLVGRPLDAIAHASEDDLRDLPHQHLTSIGDGLCEVGRFRLMRLLYYPVDKVC